jgi:PAS domain S-box-containing protein
LGSRESKGATETAIDAELNELVVRTRSPKMQGLQLLAVAVMTWLTWHPSEPWRSLLLAGLVTAAVAFNMTTYWLHDRDPDRAVRHEHWHRLIVLGGLLFGLAWGAGIAACFGTDLLGPRQSMLAVIGCGAVAAASVGYSARLAAARAMVAGFVLPLVVVLGLTGEAEAIGLAAMAVIFAIGLSLYARAIQDVQIERIRLSHELRSSGHRLNAILDAVPLPIIVIDWLDGRVRFANRRAAEMLGLDLDRTIGRVAPDMLVDKTDRGRVMAALKLGAIQNMELTVQTTRGPRDVLVSSVRMDYDGRAAILMAGNEITEQKARERELDDARRQAITARREAENSSRAKSRFLAHMSHELRTPLNAVLGFSDMMRNEVLGPLGRPTYRQYANDIHQAGVHLLELINDILDLSKIEAGKHDLSIEQVDMRRLIDASLPLVAGLAHQRGVKIETSLPEPCPALQADARATKQMLVNLLSNAVKFTPRGGTVRLAAWLDAGSWRIAIADNGVGMSARDIEIALEPFGQVDADTRTEIKGTGLGLPLTKALIELHGGALALESTRGGGTTVTLRFPSIEA